jgi:hypothetical protein
MYPFCVILILTNNRRGGSAIFTNLESGSKRAGTLAVVTEANQDARVCSTLGTAVLQRRCISILNRSSGQGDAKNGAFSLARHSNCTIARLVLLRIVACYNTNIHSSLLAAKIRSHFYHFRSWGARLVHKSVDSIAAQADENTYRRSDNSPLEKKEFRSYRFREQNSAALRLI